MDINLLVKLCARAWATAILAAFHNGVPGRQAALLGATGAGRTAFAQSLAHLQDLKLVMRNPGHGHPLRPEYRLTARGDVYAAIAARIEAAVPAKDEAALLRKAWTVPILAVAPKPTTFSHIRRTLPSLTDRALSLNLKTLQNINWLERSVDVESAPPKPIYKAANAGLRISRACVG